jgi:hypothetical protein
MRIEICIRIEKCPIGKLKFFEAKKTAKTEKQKIISIAAPRLSDSGNEGLLV